MKALVPKPVKPVNENDASSHKYQRKIYKDTLCQEQGRGDKTKTMPIHRRFLGQINVYTGNQGTIRVLLFGGVGRPKKTVLVKTKRIH
jgi:hypothetical protein